MQKHTNYNFISTLDWWSDDQNSNCTGSELPAAPYFSPTHAHFLVFLSAMEEVVVFKASISSSGDHCQFIHILV